MVRRIEVSLKPEFSDAAADALFKRLKSDFGLVDLQAVRKVSVYSFEDDLSQPELELLAREVLSDPVNQSFSIGKPVDSTFNAAIEVGFRPGVKDNVGETARGACADALGRALTGDVFTSTLYQFFGTFQLEFSQRISEGVLCNPLIEQWKLIEPNGIDAYYSNLKIPKAGERAKGTVFEIPLPDSDAELEHISKRRVLALSVDEMRAIAAYYARPDVRTSRGEHGLTIHPTDVELEAIAQTWSEHCKHKIFNATIDYTDNSPEEKEDDLIASSHSKSKAKSKHSPVDSAKSTSKFRTPRRQTIHSLFKTYISGTTTSITQAKPYLLSVFTDNAGVLAMDADWAVAIKVETHNTPSALDPYGGALTGILGVNRDILGTGMGAKPIFNTDVFCFADPFYTGKIPPRLLHPKRVFEGVRAGVERGGNASGIPTVNGSIVFDDRYLGKPLVYCGTGGIMPRKLHGRNQYEKFVQPGDRLFMVGGRVGKDGIHGATFSSEGLSESSPTSAVQLGDPITQKNMLDFLLASRDAGIHSGLTDDGAGGLSSSVGEMAQFTNGVVLHLDRCPVKYPGLDPWEILLSESQERMTVAVPVEKVGEFVALAQQWSVEATDLGEFTSTGYLHVLYYSHPVAYLDLKFLHGGLPKWKLRASWTPPPLEEPELEFPFDLTATLQQMLARPNICSKESIIRQYDHEVQGMSVIKPLCGKAGTGPSDAAVLQPVPDRPWGVVVSHGICPRFSDIDPLHMAQLAVDEAVRNYVATGGDPAHWGGLDNFCWPDPVQSPSNPSGEQKLAALVRTNQGLAEACIAYGLPLVSGKDSMKNDYAHGSIRISVPPTLLISVCGRISDVSRAVSTDFKQAGDVIYILGHTADELGGSEYYALHNVIGKNIPHVNLEGNAVLYKRLHSAMDRQLVASAHDCSDGGLAVALAECAIGGKLGCEVKLQSVPRTDGLRDDAALFSESAGRFIVSVHPQNAAAFEKAMGESTFARIGTMRGDDQFIIEGTQSGARIVAPVAKLEEAFKRTITW